jgi:hypothetical protein
MKTYVVFLSGLFLFTIESLPQGVKTRNVEINMPKSSFGFYFFDAQDAQGKKRFNISPIYYKGGTIYRVATLRRTFPNERVLIRSMEINGYKCVIRCCTGNWQPFREDSGDVQERGLLICKQHYLILNFKLSFRFLLLVNLSLILRS